MKRTSAKEVSIGGVQVDTAKLNSLQWLIRAFNHPVRLDMMKEMDKAPDGECNVTHLYVKLRLEQSVASQHLRILKAAGLVAFAKRGKEKFYKTVPATVGALNGAVCMVDLLELSGESRKKKNGKK